VATVHTLDPKARIDLVDGFPWTDSGNAERLIALHGSDVRYVRSWHKWLGWDGKCWRLDDGAPHRAAKDVARATMRQANRIGDLKRRAEAIKFALKLEAKGTIEAAVSLARHELAISIEHTELDGDPWLLCVRNGTVDLRTGELRAHERADLLTKIAPIDYDAAATCPRFEQFMLEIMGGDAALVTFLQRYLGYCVSGDVREHVLAFWHGGGCNGKSLLAFVVLRVLGDYGGKAAPDLLFKHERTERHPTEVADLHGLRLVVANETTRGRAWDEATVKDVTGGDVLRARRMREDFWSFLPTHKLVVFGNHKPRITTVDDAMRRRLRLVPFVVSFKGREDKTLQKTLLAESPGILRWLVDGCINWQILGLPDVEAIREATAGYFLDEDTLGQFLAAECLFEPNAKVARKELRERYQAWAEERGERPVGAKTLADALRDRGVTARKVKTAAGPRDGWAGVRLASDADRATDQVAGSIDLSTADRASEAGQAVVTSGEVVTRGEQIPVQQDLSVSRVTNRESLTTGHYHTTSNGYPSTWDDFEGGSK
jgi:putative DNA primase/helicase